MGGMAEAQISDHQAGSNDALAWWRLWAFAVLAHVLANTFTEVWEWRGPVNAVLGLIALRLIVRPDDRLARLGVAAGTLVSFVVEAPLVGNHWLLGAAVGLIALAAGMGRSDDDWWRRFAPTGRVALLVFYGFAAFAKLNTGFFDPVASCSRYFANRTLSFWQLPEIGSQSPVASWLPWVVAAIELSVPLLLISRRTRWIGVWLGIAFHLGIALDLRQHFFDFTMTLIPLFLLFAPPGTLAQFDRGLPSAEGLTARIWLGIFTLMLLVLGGPAPRDLKALVVLLSWLIWLILLVVLVRAFADPRALRSDPANDRTAMRPVGAAGIAIVAVMVLNGLTPYLELKTSTSFNMYSNLRVAGGESNHVIVRATAHLSDSQDTLVEVLEADGDLADYVDSGFALPATNLATFLAQNPDESATVAIDGEVVEVGEGGDVAKADQPASRELFTVLPWWVERFAMFRAVPLGEVPACQASFLPAR